MRINNPPNSSYRISNLNLNEVWSIANITKSRELKVLCVREASADFDRYITNPHFFSYVDLSGMQMLFRDVRMATRPAVAKLVAVATWMQSAETGQEQKNREAGFEALLQSISTSSISRSFFIDIATGKSPIRLPEHCR